MPGLGKRGPNPAVSPEEAGRASQVLAFDTIPAEQRGYANVTYWSGVPIGIDDYEATRNEIARRVDALLSELP